MLRILFSILLVCLPGFGQVEHLRDVKTIYVADLGTNDSARVLRARLVNRLAKSKELRVTEDPERADARLTGIVEGRDRFVNGTSLRRYDLVVKLLSRDKSVLWVKDWKRVHDGGLFNADLEDKIVRELLKAIKKDGGQ